MFVVCGAADPVPAAHGFHGGIIAQESVMRGRFLRPLSKHGSGSGSGSGSSRGTGHTHPVSLYYYQHATLSPRRLPGAAPFGGLFVPLLRLRAVLWPTCDALVRSILVAVLQFICWTVGAHVV